MRSTLTKLGLGLMSVFLITLITWLHSDPHLEAANLTGWSPILPNEPPPDLLIAVPLFAGKVLHTSLAHYGFSPAGPDSANGRIVYGDIWMQVGEESIPTNFHGLYTFTDGTFHQEIIQTRDAQTVIMPSRESPRPPFATGLASACVTHHGPSSPEQIKRVFPAFLDDKVLKRQGFQDQGFTALTKPLPVLRSLLGVQPILKFSANATVQYLTRVQVNGEGRWTKTIELSGERQLVFEHSIFINAQHELAYDYWSAYGAIEVYTVEAVPVSIFDRSHDSRQACQE